MELFLFNIPLCERVYRGINLWKYREIQQVDLIISRLQVTCIQQTVQSTEPMLFVWLCLCCYCSQWGWQQFIRSLLTGCCFLWKLRMPVHPFPSLTLVVRWHVAGSPCLWVLWMNPTPTRWTAAFFSVAQLPPWPLTTAVMEPNGPLEFFNTSLYTCHALWPRQAWESHH